jgi:hypothetical protein
MSPAASRSNFPAAKFNTRVWTTSRLASYSFAAGGAGDILRIAFRWYWILLPEQFGYKPVRALNRPEI